MSSSCNLFCYVYIERIMQQSFAAESELIFRLRTPPVHCKNVVSRCRDHDLITPFFMYAYKIYGKEKSYTFYTRYSYIYIYIFFYYENKRAFRWRRVRLYFFLIISPLRCGKKSNRNSLYYNITIHKLRDFILIDAPREGHIV